MNTTEKYPFQTETGQLLGIVIHSLYTDKEIFVRELISNASDACETLRFMQATGQPVYQPEVPFGISISADEKSGTITISDTGIGMTHAELVENLGTIAHSGTKALIEALKAADKSPGSDLIGHFGVGFYSIFMVSDKATVCTRSYLPDEKGWRWVSEGVCGYEIEPLDDLPRHENHSQPQGKRPGISQGL